MIDQTPGCMYSFPCCFLDLVRFLRSFLLGNPKKVALILFLREEIWEKKDSPVPGRGTREDFGMTRSAGLNAGG